MSSSAHGATLVRRVFVDPRAPQNDAIAEAAHWIRLGRVVAMSTDTLYGIAVDPCNAEAVARVFEAKGRPAGLALPLVAADVEQIASHLGRPPLMALRLADRFWPGPLAVLMPAPPALAVEVTAGTGTVAVRVPNFTIARAVCRACGHPVTATSANISGEVASADPDEVERT